jgi:hypothetical protein
MTIDLDRKLYLLRYIIQNYDLPPGRRWYNDYKETPDGTWLDEVGLLTISRAGDQDFDDKPVLRSQLIHPVTKALEIWRQLAPESAPPHREHKWGSQYSDAEERCVDYCVHCGMEKPDPSDSRHAHPCTKKKKVLTWKG